MVEIKQSEDQSLQKVLMTLESFSQAPENVQDNKVLRPEDALVPPTSHEQVHMNQVFNPDYLMADPDKNQVMVPGKAEDDDDVYDPEKFNPMTPTDVYASHLDSLPQDVNQHPEPRKVNTGVNTALRVGAAGAQLMNGSNALIYHTDYNPGAGIATEKPAAAVKVKIDSVAGSELAGGGDTLPELPSLENDIPAGSEKLSDTMYFNPNISPALKSEIDRQAGELYSTSKVPPEAFNGLPLGSIYLKVHDVANNREIIKQIAMYEKQSYSIVDFTPIDGKDTGVVEPQNTAGVLINKSIQWGINDSDVYKLPDYMGKAIDKLPIAGDGSVKTPTFGQFLEWVKVPSQDDLFDRTKNLIIDKDWTHVSKHLPAGEDVQLTDLAAQGEPLTFQDPGTLHKMPDSVYRANIKSLIPKEQTVDQVLADANEKTFVEGQLINSFGSIVAPTLEVTVNEGGKDVNVLIVVNNKLIQSVNYNHSADTRVQLLNTGATLLKAYKMEKPVAATPTPLPTQAPVETPTSQPLPPTHEAGGNAEVTINLPNNHGTIKIEGAPFADFQAVNQDILNQMFEKVYESTGESGDGSLDMTWLPYGNDLIDAFKSESKKYKGHVVHSISTPVDATNEVEFFFTDNGILQIPPMNESGQDNIANIPKLWQRTNVDNIDNYVSEQLLVIFLIASSGGQITQAQIHDVLGPDLGHYIFGTSDGHGGYNIPPALLKVVRK